jgi:N-acetyl-gamma-glutamyl-phosphate reductase
MFKIGIVGVSGYGGGEALRLCAGHPHMQVVFVAGESSAGSRLGDKFPGLSGALAELIIQKWDPATLPELDLLFASLPTGQSQAALAQVRAATRIIDIGGDHRFADGWTYGLADVWPEQIRGQKRIANPGCFPAASLGALAPLLAGGLIEPANILIDAKTGVSGAGRGGGGTFGYAEVNEDVAAYGLLKHPHAPEMVRALARVGSGKWEVGSEKSPASHSAVEHPLTFTPHLIPMTRGILATCYATGTQGVTTEQCLAAARDFYRDRPFVRITDRPPHTKWAAGSNLLFVSYAADPDRRRVIALGAIDNLGKGAAGQAVQNANLALGLDETLGLSGGAIWP